MNDNQLLISIFVSLSIACLLLARISRTLHIIQSEERHPKYIYRYSCDGQSVEYGAETLEELERMTGLDFSGTMVDHTKD